jgi:hypothetical protein
LPSVSTSVDHLGLEMADPRQDAHDPDGIQLRFVSASESA